MRRVHFVFISTLNGMIQYRRLSLSKFEMIGEAYFDLNGFVNKQNCHYWSEENLCQLQRLFHSKDRVTSIYRVWCAIFHFGVIDP